MRGQFVSLLASFGRGELVRLANVLTNRVGFPVII